MKYTIGIWIVLVLASFMFLPIHGIFGQVAVQKCIGTNLCNGTSGDDNMVGDSANNNMDGLDGSDIMKGGIGDDSVYGASGNDDLDGQRGKDEVWGSFGNDNIFGRDGPDETDKNLRFDMLVLILRK